MPPRFIHKPLALMVKNHSANFEIPKMIDKEVRQFLIETKGDLSGLKLLPRLFISTASEISTSFC